MYKIKKFFGKIIKIFQYIPLLWMDEDWCVTSLLKLIDFKVQKMVKYVRKNDYIIDEEIVAQEIFAKKLHQTIEKFIDSGKYFPMQHYWDKYGATFKFVDASYDEKYGQLRKLIDVFEDTEEEIPEEHEYYKYVEKYIDRIIKYETAAWNRIWNMLKKDGHKLGD